MNLIKTTIQNICVDFYNPVYTVLIAHTNSPVVASGGYVYSSNSLGAELVRLRWPRLTLTLTLTRYFDVMVPAINIIPSTKAGLMCIIFWFY